MADNCSILEPWSVLSIMGGGGWGQDMASRESEAFARALQASLTHQPDSLATAASNDHHHQQQEHHVSNYLSSPSSLDQYYSSPSSQLLPSPTTPSSAPFLANPELVLPVPPPPAAATPSDSDSPTAAKKSRFAATTGRVSKRRPRRASKRSPTTFIAADPANFRQMVQEVTGVQIPVVTSGGCGGSGLPLLSPASFLARPQLQPQRVGDPMASWQQGQMGGSCLPTLDTSAFVIDGSTVASSSVSPPPSTSVAFSSGGLDMGLPCFPTLESSWEVK